MTFEFDGERICAHACAMVRAAMENNDVAHDYAHVERVVKLARELVSCEPDGDPFLTELLAWLHDMDDPKLDSHKETAVLFLKEHGFSREQTEAVLAMMERVSFSRYPVPDPSFPLELQIVRDADRLDAIGAIGVARCFAYSGAKGIPFYAGPPGGTALSHFEEKLLTLQETLYTDRAKEIARDRAAFLRDFYEEFRREAGFGKKTNG